MGQMPVIGVGGPLVGRDTEIGLLRAEVERAWSGVTRCVLIGGEAGIGKTRLAGALVDLAGERGPGGSCGVGAVRGPGGGRHALHTVPARDPHARRRPRGETPGRGAGGGAGELARLLPDLGPSSVVVESEVGRGRLFEAIARLLEHAAAERPLVVVLEDLHWADASTRELVSFLVRTLDDTRVLLAVTYRADEMHRRHPLRPLLAELERHPRVSTLSVGRLDAAQVEVLLESLRADHPSRAVVADVVERSGGVPFYVEELATRTPGQPLPDTLRDLLLVRVEALSPAAQRVLAAAAVGGARVAHADLVRREWVWSRTGWMVRCGRRWTPGCCWWTGSCPGTRFGMRCCARPCSTTCCPGSRPRCMSAGPGCCSSASTRQVPRRGWRCGWRTTGTPPWTCRAPSPPP